ncbi:MAG: hypothetical protein ACYTFK_02035 [Planctomycetota bacterium]|jgi:hypothetical protein
MTKEADGLENLPAVASEYIEAIIRKMRYRRKVRQEVRKELAGHFGDALADCQTDEEKQAKAQELINEFGDAKLLATLIRRGKKRCRPLWRTIVARSFQAIGLAILLVIVYLVWFFSGKPNPTIDYVAQMNSAARPAADDSLNAGPLYHKAAELFEDPHDAFVKEHPDLLAMSYNEATDQQKEVLSKWIDENEEVLGLVAAGAAKPYYWPKYEGQEALSVLLPNLSNFRNMARTLRWRALLRAEEGLYQDAFEDLKNCYRLGRHLKGDKTLIEQLVGIAIESMTTATLRDILDKYEFNEPDLAAMAEGWSELILQEDFTVSIKAEKFFMLDEIQRCFTDDRIGGGHLYLKRLAGLGFPSAKETFTNFLHMLFTHPNRQETLETINKYWDYFEEVARKSPGQRRTEQIDVDKDIEPLWKDNLFMQILLPALNKVSIIGYRNKANAEAMLGLIAILRHKEKSDNFPESLDELVESGLLKALPIDPFSDKPLVYRKTDDGFTLYSVSENFTDDGGKLFIDSKGKVKIWADDGDAVFWPVD